MPRKQADSAPAETNAAPAVDLRTWLYVGGIMLLGALLRGVRLAEPPGGYLVFNENFYLNAAQANAKGGLFSWFITRAQADKPPMFEGLVSILLRLNLPLVGTARFVSVFAGLATILLTFLIGRLLFNQRTGLVAAALLAVMPGVVLVDHNIQTDPLLVALTMAGLYFYLLSVQTDRRRDSIWGGALLGLGILTKQPAVLVLPALAIWESWRSGGISWLRERRVWWFAGIALAVGASWYLAELAISPTSVVGGMVATASRTSGIGLDFWRDVFVGELAWMLFPLTALLAVAGLGYIAWRRSSGDKLLLILAATYAVYYVAVHLHSYYLLPVAPILALVVARLCVGLLSARIPWRWARVGLFAALLIAMTFASVVMMGGQKWGRWSPMALTLSPDAGFSQVHVFYDPDLDGFYSSMQKALDPRYSPMPASLRDFVAAPTVPGTENLFLSTRLSTPDGTLIPSREDLNETWLRPVLFGYAIGQRWPTSSEVQVFRNAPWTAEQVGPLWRFGVESTPESTVYAIYTTAPFSRPK